MSARLCPNLSRELCCEEFVTAGPPEPDRSRYLRGVTDTAEFDNAVRLATYGFFADEGRAPVAAEVARGLDVLPVQVEQSFKRLHEAHVIVLAPGTPYIWMANPFSALPTPYSVTCGDKTYWANCIWDSLGIISMLAADGTVTSSCPDCGQQLRVEVAGGELKTSDYLVHYAVPAARWWDDIGFN